MAKKKETLKSVKAELKAVKDEFAIYRQATRSHLSRVLNPEQKVALSVGTYTQDKKPVMISSPELAAIVGTAAKLNNRAFLQLRGQGEKTTIELVFEKFPPKNTYDVKLY